MSIIDIIIPCYNAFDTIDNTLHSICTQTIKEKVNVLLVDDCSNNNYDDYTNKYNKIISIKQLRLDNNCGAGKAREVGINNTNSKYILFIDSDDSFYSNDSLEKLLNKIEEGYDIVYSAEYDEKRDGCFVSNGNLHGKIYRREFIIDKDIHYNDSRYHEDNFFNNLVLLSGARKYFLKEVTYYYSYNKKSLTNNEYDDFNKMKLYIKNMSDVLKLAREKNYSKIRINRYLVDNYKFYKRVYDLYNDEHKKIFKEWVNKYDPVFLKFIDLDELTFMNELLLFVFNNIDGDD